MNRLSSLILICLTLAGSLVSSNAQETFPVQFDEYPDHIMVQPRMSAGKRRIRCRIMDYTGQLVTVRQVDANANQTYPTSQVTHVETPQTPSHREGVRLLSAGKIQEAEEKLLVAHKQDPRAWVQREILSHLVRAALLRGDYVTAAYRMKEIYNSDRTTHYLELLPAVWSERVLDPSIIRNASDLLSDDSEITQLVAASILLFQNGFENLAQQKLLELKTTGSPRLQPLAAAQLWRLELKQKDLAVFTLDQWKRQIERLPTELRGGPYFVLGEAYRYKLLRDEAALTYLRIPILYNHDRKLAAEACLAAAEILQSAGRGSEAIAVYRELASNYTGTSPARKADAILKSLANR